MIEDPADVLLRDIPVDQPGPQGVSPLVGGEMHPAAVLVLDVAAFQPPVERQPVSRAAGRRLPVKVLGRPGKQARWPGGPALQDPVLLLADQGMQIILAVYDRLSSHLLSE